MLDSNLKHQLQVYLEKLLHPIELVASLGYDEASSQTRELLAEIASVSQKVSVREDGEDRYKPSFSVNRVGENTGIRFAGLPMGHEFTSLVLALLQVGGHPPKVDAEILEQIRQLPGEHEFVSYISLSCQNCPDVVQALNLMALLNPNIRHTTVDGALFQDEIKQRNVMAVPSVFRNGELFGQGRLSIEEILLKLDTGAADRESAKISNKAPFDLLVIGGGPAGAAAAIYSARKGIRTGIVADRFGGQVLDTMSIENFISVKETEGPKLVSSLEQHVRAYDVDIMNAQRAQKLLPRAENSAFQEILLDSGATLKAKSIIISTGARWREMNVPGETEYRNKGVAYCPHCDGPLFKGKRVAVIGGGNSGVEAAIDLAGITAHVTLLEFAPELRADSVLQAKLRSLKNVTIITHALSTEVKGDGQRVTELHYTDRADNSAHTIALDGIFVQIGLLPNTDWLKGSIDLSPHGEIQIDSRNQTSQTGVFAAGDCTTVPYKQIIIAMGEGAKAALSAFDHLIRA